MLNFNDYKFLVVHGGIFHADDVFVTAFCNLLCDRINKPRLKIIRTFSITVAMSSDNRYLIADIGKGKFDHHFPDDQKKKRENGCPYAAFGLVVKEFYNLIMSEEEYQLLDKRFIENIDWADNNGGINHLSAAISVFNTPWDSMNPNDDIIRFYEAVDLAEKILAKELEHVKSLASAKKIADESPRDGDCIFLDSYVPIGEFLIESEINFIGSYSKRGGYQVVSVRSSSGGNKKLFPEEFRGYNGEANEYNMTFCHSSGFLASFLTKEDAKNFMHTVMGKNNHKIISKFIQFGKDYDIDVSKYINGSFTDEQLSVIYTGLMSGVDVSRFTYPNYSIEDMRKILAELEDKLW